MKHLQRRRPLLSLATVTAVVAGLASVVPVPAVAASPAGVRQAAAAPDDVWTEVSERATAQRGGLRATVNPADYGAYHLDLDALGALLATAPLEGTASRAAGPLLVEVPAPDGELVEFAIAESPVMEDGLAALHPDIHTYAGRTTGDSTASIRLDVTPLGFHASVRGDGAAWYVDPAYLGVDQGDDALYLSYTKDSLPEPEQRLVEPDVPELETAGRAPTQSPSVGEGGGAVAIQRTYRLALVSDPSYAEYFTSSTDNTTVNTVVAAAKATLVNRVNQLYGDDLSIRLVLVAANDQLNFNTDAQFRGANGRCGSSSCYTTGDVGCGTNNGQVLDTNTDVVNQLIGSAGYDVGHIVFGADGNGGGLAALGSVGSSFKGAGCTGLSAPVGDGFAIDYVAHELGHQFDANHTFNGNTTNCASSNRNNATAVEPGSGTSIMAYAGICGIDNLQNHSDPYFSQRSQAEIAAFVRGTASAGGAVSTTGNHNPTVTAPAARTIPIRTPFQLTGSATDPDGDALVYLWEQNNPGSGTVLSSNTKNSGPLFRVFGTYAAVNAAGTQQYDSPGLNGATSSPTRSFPDAAQVAAGETNAASGSCPSLSGTGTADTAALRCMSEFLPTTARSLGFRLTARDLGGSDGGSDGGTSFADTAVTVGSAGPFLVSSQASATSVTGGTTGTVTWAVNGTNSATYATDVRISFSTDGGLTFPTVIAASTPNDGTETITWPNTTTSQGRVRIEAVDNYFYDVNDANISVTPGATPTLTTGGNAAGQTFTAASSDALATTPTITAQSNTVTGSAISMTATGLPAGLSLTRGADTANGTTYTVTGTAAADPATYAVTVTVSDGAGNAADQTVGFSIVVSKDTAALAYTGDTAGQTGTRTVSVTVADTDATPGTVTGTVAFTDATLGTALCTATVTGTTASCTFSAPVPRTYAVVGTLTSTRYTGASAPVDLVVSATPVDTLTTGGNAAGGTFTAPSSDPFGTVPSITAEASAADGDDITMTATGLPAGSTLVRTEASADGARPGTTRFEVAGTTADAGTYPVTVTVTDGPGAAADRTVSFTVVITRDTATLDYTGDTTGTGGATTLSVAVTDDDATPGTVAGTVDFTDTSSGDDLCSAPVVAGEASCTVDVTTTRTLQVVGTLDSARYTGASAAAPVTITVPTPPDTTAPQTTIAVGPAQGSTQLARDLGFRATSSETGSTFRCTLNNRSVACASGTAILRSLAGGSYDFRVTATDAAGNTDVTPALRRFYVPVADRSLRAAKGPWQRRTSAQAFRGTYTSVARTGAVLTYPVRRAASLALVVSTGRGFGAVDVFLGSRRLTTIRTAGAARTQRVVAIRSFPSATTGTVRIVTRSRAQVRIEGLVVRSATATPRMVGRPGELDRTT